MFNGGINYSLLSRPYITFDYTKFGSGFSYTFRTSIKTYITADLDCSIGLTDNNFTSDVDIRINSASH
jgi:hypothetical protein